ncbi:MAG: DUF3883 domain-containing protein [Gemmataceae bacterium]
MILRLGRRELAVRLSFFSVTDSARGRPHERRIEITTTYARGLQPDPVFRDVVIGYERTRGTYVGVDPRRLWHGGPTSNASTFFSASGLVWTTPDRLLVLPYSSQLFGGTEYHAFFEANRFVEYLFNLDEIHAGAYTGMGPFSRPSGAGPTVPLSVPDDAADGDVLILDFANNAPARRRPGNQLIAEFESGEQPPPSRRRVTAEEFAAIKRQCEENGLLGEQFVLDFEKTRLSSWPNLASNIQWISQQSVGEGYDIKSFENTGADRLIEVKATVGLGRTFEMSDKEWQTALQFGACYFIYRVFQVRANRPRIELFQDPCQLQSTGQIQRIPSGWRVTC